MGSTLVHLGLTLILKLCESFIFTYGANVRVRDGRVWQILMFQFHEAMRLSLSMLKYISICATNELY